MSVVMLRRQPTNKSIPRILVVLDPAKHRCGVALFGQSILFAAKTVTVSRGPGHTKRLADAIQEYVDEACKIWQQPMRTASGVSRVVWVAEVPVVYEGKRAKAKSLTGLFDLVEEIASRVGRVRGATPFRWKGNTTKKVTERRVRRRLPSWELLRLEDESDDTFDAVGIGLWYLGRVGQGVTELRGSGRG